MKKRYYNINDLVTLGITHKQYARHMCQAVGAVCRWEAAA